MHWNHWLSLVLMLSLTACASRRRGAVTKSFPGTSQPASAPAAYSPSPSGSGATIVTPANPKVGRVSLVNVSARYVIVTYGVGHLPAPDARLHVYRDGLKVAELKVSAYNRDIHAAADIVSGECRVGDEVRER